jgi:hypothetical protein
MKVGSIQGIPHAYYLKNGKNELRTVQAIKNVDRKYSSKAVHVSISSEAKALHANMTTKGIK